MTAARQIELDGTKALGRLGFLICAGCLLRNGARCLAVLACSLVALPCLGAELPLRAYSADYDEIDPNYTPPSSFFDADPKLEVRVNNDGKAVAADLLPLLLWKTPFTIDPAHHLASGFLPSNAFTLAGGQCHTVEGRTWEATLKNVFVLAPGIDGKVFDLHFSSGKRVEADFNAPNLLMTLELEWLSKHDNNFYCNTFGSDWRASTIISVSGVSGNLDVTLNGAENAELSIKTVDRFNLEAGTVRILSPNFLDTLINYSLGAADLFGVGCGPNLNACVDTGLKSYMTGNAKLKTDIKKALNDALKQLTKIESARDLAKGKVDYVATLTAVSTSESKNRLRTKWDLDFSTNEPDASCAKGLLHSSYISPADTTTTADLDVVIPKRKITDLLYVVARQGDMCAPFPWQGTTVEVKPNGAFSISNVIGTGAVFKVSLPVKIEVQVTSQVQSSITATLETFYTITPNCTSLTLTATRVNLANAIGTIRYQPPGGAVISMDAATFISIYKAPAEAAILAQLQPPITATPGMFGLAGLNKYLRLGTILWGSGEVTVGLNLMPGACN